MYMQEDCNAGRKGYLCRNIISYQAGLSFRDFFMIPWQNEQRNSSHNSQPPPRMGWEGNRRKRYLNQCTTGDTQPIQLTMGPWEIAPRIPSHPRPSCLFYHLFQQNFKQLFPTHPFSLSQALCCLCLHPASFPHSPTLRTSEAELHLPLPCPWQLGDSFNADTQCHGAARTWLSAALTRCDCSQCRTPPVSSVTQDWGLTKQVWLPRPHPQVTHYPVLARPYCSGQASIAQSPKTQEACSFWNNTMVTW